MNQVTGYKESLDSWRDSLTPGDMVSIETGDGLQWVTAHIIACYGDHFRLARIPKTAEQRTIIILSDWPTSAVFPPVDAIKLNDIAGALQGCNSGHTRPTAHATAINRRTGHWWKRLAGFLRFFLTLAKPPTISPGSSPRERYEKKPMRQTN